MNTKLATNNALGIRPNSLTPSILLDSYKPVDGSKQELSFKATIFRYLSILKDGWMKILFTTLILMFLALLLAILTNASYTAKATLKINLDPTQYLEYQVDAKRPTSYVNDEFFYNTEDRLLRSRDLAKKVIADLNIEDTLLKEKKFKGIVYIFTAPIKLFFNSIKAFLSPSSDESTKLKGITADDIFLEKLVILPVRNSRLITIKYTSNDPVLATEVVNKLVENYILSKYLNKKLVADNASAFLNKKIKEARKALYIAEFNLINYSKHNDIIDIDADKSIMASNLESLNKAYISAINKRISIQQSYSIKKDITGNNNYFTDPVIQAYKKELNKVQAIYQGNLENFKPKHPSMIGLAAKIKKINNNIAMEFEKIKANEIDTFEAALKVSSGIESELKGKIESYEGKLLKYRDNKIEYSSLKREVDTSKDLYSGLIKRLKEVSIAPIKADNILVVDSAEMPHRRDSPRFKKYLALGLLIGLFLSIASVLLKEMLSPIIRSSDDIEAISSKYKVLATLPKIKNKKGLVNFINHKKTRQSFQSIYTSMPLEGLFPKCLHVTSATENEGKTAVAVNLAVSIAKLNKTVLLIDANLSDPKIHEYFSLDNKHGLNEFLTKDDKKIVNTVMNKKLFVITAGSPKDDPMTVLSNPKFIKFLEVSSKMFDHIIIDSSPIISCAESRIIANQTSATLVVVGEKKVFKKDLEDTLSLLDRAGATLVGFVNNMSSTKLKA